MSSIAIHPGHTFKTDGDRNDPRPFRPMMPIGAAPNKQLAIVTTVADCLSVATQITRDCHQKPPGVPQPGSRLNVLPKTALVGY